MATWEISYGTQKIPVNFGHVQEAINAACSVLTKEQIHNPRINDNEAQKKAYEIHVSILRLLEKVFQEGFEKFEEHQRRMIPHGKR